MSWILLHFCLGWAYVAGFFATNARFVSRFGSAPLFDVYLGQGLATIALSFLFYRFADRYRRKAFGIAWFFFLGCFVLLWAGLMELFPNEQLIYVAARACLDAVAISSSLAFWLLAGEHTTHREAKRRFPNLLAAFILGDMAGGYFLQVTEAWLSCFDYLTFWALVLAFLPMLLIRQNSSPRNIKPAHQKIFRKPAEGRTRSAFCGFSLLLLVFWGLYSFFSDSTDYVFNTLALESFAEEAALRTYFGQVALLGNGIIALYHLGIGKRMVRKFGLDFSVVCIPLIIFSVWTLAYFEPSLLTLGLAQGLIYFFIDYVAVSQLNTSLMVFPKKLRGRMQALTEGFGRALGFLALFAIARCFAYCPTVEEMSLLIWLAACLFLGFPKIFRPVYFRHLLSGLGSQDRWLVKNARQGLQPFLKYPSAWIPESHSAETLRRMLHQI